MNVYRDRLLCLACCGALSLTAACPSETGKSPPAKHLTGTIIMNGSTTVYPVAKKAADVLAQRHPGLNFQLEQSSTGEGLVKFLNNELNIANGTRPPNDKEYQSAESKGLDIQMTVIANDAVAVHVNAETPIDTVDLKTVKAIFFDGTITDWSQITNKKSGRINIYTTDPANSGTAQLFNHKLTGKDSTPYVAGVNGNLREAWGYRGKDGNLWVHPTPRMIDALGADSNGIGFVPLNWIEADSKTGTSKVKALKVDGIYPTRETILDASYPLARKMYMMTNGTPAGAVRDYINFILSSEGQKIAAEEGFIPIVGGD